MEHLRNINSWELSQVWGRGRADQRAVPSEGSVCWGQRFWQTPYPRSDLKDVSAATCSRHKGEEKLL